MPNERSNWRSSFYWRIAGGFVMCLVGVLAAQAGAMFWLVDRANSEARLGARGYCRTWQPTWARH